MLIDWFTIIAQVVNFLILVALLKYFLYDRIVQAMNEREEKIAARLNDAETQKKQADAEARRYEKKNQELEDRADRLITAAKEEAEAKRDELMAQARGETEDLRTKWLDALAREKKSILGKMRSQVGMSSLSVAKKALAELADLELQDRVVAAFLQRLENLEDNKVTEIRDSLVNGDKTVRVRSAIELSSESRQAIREALEQRIQYEIDIRFEESPELTLGLELKFQDYKIGWSVESYLDSVEQNLSRIIDNDVDSRSPSQ